MEASRKTMAARRARSISSESHGKQDSAAKQGHNDVAGEWRAGVAQQQVDEAEPWVKDSEVSLETTGPSMSPLNYPAKLDLSIQTDFGPASQKEKPVKWNSCLHLTKNKTSIDSRHRDSGRETRLGLVPIWSSPTPFMRSCS